MRRWLKLSRRRIDRSPPHGVPSLPDIQTDRAGPRVRCLRRAISSSDARDCPPKGPPGRRRGGDRQHDIGLHRRIRRNSILDEECRRTSRPRASVGSSVRTLNVMRGPILPIGAPSGDNHVFGRLIHLAISPPSCADRWRMAFCAEFMRTIRSASPIDRCFNTAASA